MTALAAVNKGMRAVKLCSNKILQDLTGGAGNLYNTRKMVVFDAVAGLKILGKKFRNF